MITPTGFITLHRKITENPIWKNPNAGHLFVTLLLLANHEQTRFLWNGQEMVLERGQLLTGRFALSELTGIAPGTIYDNLRLLEKLGMISVKSNNKFSIITIVKYSDYQDKKERPNNKPTTNQQQTNNQPTHTTIITTNNNDNNTPTNVGAKADKRHPVIQELWQYGLQMGLPPTKQQLNRFAIKRLLSQHPPDKLKKALEFSQEIRDEPYAPQVNNWMDLEDKYLKLRDFVQRSNSKAKENQGKSIRLWVT